MSDLWAMIQEALAQPGGQTWVTVTIAAGALALLAILAGVLLKALRMIAILVFVAMLAAALFGGWQSVRLAELGERISGGPEARSEEAKPEAATPR